MLQNSAGTQNSEPTESCGFSPKFGQKLPDWSKPVVFIKLGPTLVPVIKVWVEQVAGEIALDRWQSRIRILRKKPKGGTETKKSEIKKEKQHLKEKREKLEVIAESRDLSKQEWGSLRCVSDRL